MKERGFTIMEVIVAVLIFGVAMLSALSFHSFGYNTLRRTKEQSYALQLAHNELSKARLKCPVNCPPFNNDEDSGMKTVHYVPELDQYYEVYLSWTQFDRPFGMPPSSHDCVYDWYKIITTTIAWKSNIDKTEHMLNLCTIGVKAPYHKIEYNYEPKDKSKDKPKDEPKVDPKPKDEPKVDPKPKPKPKPKDEPKVKPEEPEDEQKDEEKNKEEKEKEEKEKKKEQNTCW